MIVIAIIVTTRFLVIDMKYLMVNNKFNLLITFTLILILLVIRSDVEI
ncbi:hypothetical protein [Candidatus Vesicomyidisocius calyptogenae]|nr:hypothetical protein [Candidatus Vesicomyosocius okutanii]